MPLCCAEDPPSLVWSSDRIELPLVRGEGDPRPKIEVSLDEHRDPTLAILDVGGEEIRVGALLAARSGLDFRGRTVIPWLRVGDLVINDASARIVSGSELFIGLGALPDTAVQISASEGLVRLGKGKGSLEAISGGCLPLAHREGLERLALPVTIGETDAAMRLRTDLRQTTLVPSQIVSIERWRDRAPGAVEELALGDVRFSERWLPYDESISGEGVAGDLAAELLSSLDLAIDADRGCLSLARARAVLWSDESALRLSWAERRAARSEAVAGTSDPVARSELRALSALRWEVGDEAAALQSDRDLASIAGDRCELWQAVGIHALRAGDPSAAEAFSRVEGLTAPWRQADPLLRERARAGEALRRAPREPDPSCEGPPPPLPVSEGQLRQRIAEGRESAAVRALLARRLFDDGRHLPALAALRDGLGPDPHPLTSALVLGPALLHPDAMREPCCLSSFALARFALGGSEDPSLAGALIEQREQRPGDPSAICQAALYDALLGPAQIPSHPEADCLSAAILLELFRGEIGEANALARRLAERWPEVFPDDPSLLAGLGDEP